MISSISSVSVCTSTSIVITILLEGDGARVVRAAIDGPDQGVEVVVVHHLRRILVVLIVRILVVLLL